MSAPASPVRRVHAYSVTAGGLHHPPTTTTTHGQRAGAARWVGLAPKPSPYPNCTCADLYAARCGHLHCACLPQARRPTTAAAIHPMRPVSDKSSFRSARCSMIHTSWVCTQDKKTPTTLKRAHCCLLQGPPPRSITSVPFPTREAGRAVCLQPPRSPKSDIIATATTGP